VSIYENYTISNKFQSKDKKLRLQKQIIGQGGSVKRKVMDWTVRVQFYTEMGVLLIIFHPLSVITGIMKKTN
jgi:hypothetical protein